MKQDISGGVQLKNFDCWENLLSKQLERLRILPDTNHINTVIEDLEDLYNYLQNQPMTEDYKEAIQNALYATQSLTPVECENITDGILQYIKESGFEIIKTHPARIDSKDETVEDIHQRYMKKLFNSKEGAEEQIQDFHKDCIYDFSGIPEAEKDKLVRVLVEITAKHALQLFMSLGLKTHIESMVVNDATGEEFIFSFKKIPKQ